MSGNRYTGTMAATTRMKLRPADEKIVSVLKEGRNIAPNIATETGLSRQYVTTRLGELQDSGYVENLGNGLYELKETPDFSEAGR